MDKDNKMLNSAILVPSLNPDEHLPEYVRGLKQNGFNTIIIVDDGSGKEYREIFDGLETEYECTVLRHAINMGKGRALKTGFNYFLNTFNSDTMCGVVTADADGQHSVEDTVKVAKRMAETNAFVLGTRDFNIGNVPFKSSFGNKATTFMFALLYGKKINDTQTGLRGLPYSMVKREFVAGGGYERFDYEINVLIHSVKNNIPIVEEPIETIYYDSNRATHFSPIKDSFKIYMVMLRSFLRFCFSAILSFVIDISLFDILLKMISKYGTIAASTLWATTGARVISSLFNYSFNKQAVFLNKSGLKGTMLRYYILCVLQTACSWLLVNAFFKLFPLNLTFIKVLVDSFLFVISYQIQQKWVFREEGIC